MSVRLGDIAPDFEAPTTQGPIKFHEWKAGAWAILFSHPREYAARPKPILGAAAKARAVAAGAAVQGLHTPGG